MDFDDHLAMFLYIFRLDCLRVDPQTYIFLKSGDRDLSIALLKSWANCVCWKI